MLVKSLYFGLIAVSCLLAAVLPLVDLSALSVPPAPTGMSIIDQTNTLTDDQKSTLAVKIARERQASGNQIAVLIISSLEGEAIEDYSLRVAREWGIGTDENNNGVLLIIAKDDQQLRIEVGTGLEGALTDAQSGRIIRDDISPLFQRGRYYEGIDAGVTGIISTISGEYEASAQTETSGDYSTSFEAAATTVCMIISWIGSILARTKSWWAGGVIGGLAGVLFGFMASSLPAGIAGVVVLGGYRLIVG